MKNIFLILLFFSFIGCDKENDNEEIINDVTYRYDELTKADPGNKVQTYIHDFYKNTGVVIIKNPEPIDYKFNFNDQNGTIIVAPEQDDELLEKGINLIEEVLLNYYLYTKDDKENKNYDFIKKYFPFTIQMADTIKRVYMFGDEVEYPNIGLRKLIAISGINEDIDEIKDYKLTKLKANVHSTFWQDHMINYTHKFIVPTEYYNVSKDYHDQVYTDELLSHEDWINYYQDDIVDEHIEDFKGMFYDKGFMIPNYDAVYEYYYYYSDPKYISKDSDVKDFIKGMFLLSPEKFEDIKSKHKNIELKYNILRESIIKQFNIDIADFIK